MSLSPGIHVSDALSLCGWEYLRQPLPDPQTNTAFGLSPVGQPGHFCSLHTLDFPLWLAHVSGSSWCYLHLDCPFPGYLSLLLGIQRDPKTEVLNSPLMNTFFPGCARTATCCLPAYLTLTALSHATAAQDAWPFHHTHLSATPPPRPAPVPSGQLEWQLTLIACATKQVFIIGPHCPCQPPEHTMQL